MNNQQAAQHKELYIGKVLRGTPMPSWKSTHSYSFIVQRVQGNLTLGLAHGVTEAGQVYAMQVLSATIPAVDLSSPESIALWSTGLTMLVNVKGLAVEEAAKITIINQ